jgi:hypothetical protein
MRVPTLLLLAALAGSGCATDLPPLPPEPGQGEDPGIAAEPPPADPAEGAPAPARPGTAILDGVVLLDPSLDAAAATASFGVRNETGKDLPDLILAVIFSVGPVGGGGPELPRFETVEAPLRAGESRRFRVTLSALRGGETPASFRVAAGVPEVLTAGGDGMPGTTFLGGLLECVLLEADLTGPRRQVTVGLADRGAGPGGRKGMPLEGQLLLGRAGDLVYAGPWILVPRADPDGGKVRRIQWNLDAAPGLGGCDVFLRIREKR